MSTLINKSTDKFFNCVVMEFLHENGYTFFLVKHIQSLQEIPVYSMVAAYKVAKLLDLDYRVSDWINTR